MDEMRKVRSIIAQELNIDEDKIQPKATLNDLGIDSLALLELIMCLEMEFDIVIEDDEVASLKNMEDLLNLVEKKL